tara:strand:+ start:6370 stop:7044 length:675 start_codon:yes stop_codon:yes gene_type:complete
MTKAIIIFGSGYHSKVILSEIIRAKKYKVIGFIDEKLKPGTIVKVIKNKKYKVLTNIKGLGKKLNKNIYGVIGIGENFIRKKVYLQVKQNIKKFKWATIVSKNAVIDKEVKIGEGTVIISSVTINTGTKLGKHCLINTSSSIDHDNYFDNFSSCGPGAVTGGNVILGECSHIGIGSTIKHNIKIGKNTVVGGKSLVIKNCDNNSVYFGLPSKKISTRKHNQKYL